MNSKSIAIAIVLAGGSFFLLHFLGGGSKNTQANPTTQGGYDSYGQVPFQNTSGGLAPHTAGTNKNLTINYNLEPKGNVFPTNDNVEMLNTSSVKKDNTSPNHITQTYNTKNNLDKYIIDKSINTSLVANRPSRLDYINSKVFVKKDEPINKPSYLDNFTQLRQNTYNVEAHTLKHSVTPTLKKKTTIQQAQDKNINIWREMVSKTLNNDKKNNYLNGQNYFSVLG